MSLYTKNLAESDRALENELIPLHEAEAKAAINVEETRISQEIGLKKIELKKLYFSYPFNFNRILILQNEIELLERRAKQIGRLYMEMFTE